MRELAARVGTSNQQISHLELGKRQLTTDWLIRLSAALDCHPWAIVEGAPASPSERERRLLENFRRMSEKQQDSLLADTSHTAGRVGVRKHRAS